MINKSKDIWIVNRSFKKGELHVIDKRREINRLGIYTKVYA